MAAKEEKGFVFARPKDCGQKTRSRACSLLWMSSGTKTLSRTISVSKFESHVDETSNVIWRSFNILLDLSGRGHILRSFSCTWAYRIPYFSHNRKILFRVQLFTVIFFFFLARGLVLRAFVMKESYFALHITTGYLINAERT